MCVTAANPGCTRRRAGLTCSLFARAQLTLPPSSPRSLSQFVYAVLGGYAAIIALVQIRGSFASAAKISATPMPTAPDYHTRASSSGRARALACARLSPTWNPRLTPPPLRAPSHAHPSSRRFAAIVVSSDIPDFGTPAWEAFVEKDPNNFQVWLESGFKTA